MPKSRGSRARAIQMDPPDVHGAASAMQSLIDSLRDAPPLLPEHLLTEHALRIEPRATAAAAAAVTPACDLVELRCSLDAALARLEAPPPRRQPLSAADPNVSKDPAGQDPFPDLTSRCAAMLCGAEPMDPSAALSDALEVLRQVGEEGSGGDDGEGAVLDGCGGDAERAERGRRLHSALSELCTRRDAVGGAGGAAPAPAVGSDGAGLLRAPSAAIQQAEAEIEASGASSSAAPSTEAGAPPPGVPAAGTASSASMRLRRSHLLRQLDFQVQLRLALAAAAVRLGAHAESGDMLGKRAYRELKTLLQLLGLRLGRPAPASAERGAGGEPDAPAENAAESDGSQPQPESQTGSRPELHPEAQPEPPSVALEDASGGAVGASGTAGGAAEGQAPSGPIRLDGRWSDGRWTIEDYLRHELCPRYSSQLPGLMRKMCDAFSTEMPEVASTPLPTSAAATGAASEARGDGHVSPTPAAAVPDAPTANPPGGGVGGGGVGGVGGGGGGGGVAVGGGATAGAAMLRRQPSLKELQLKPLAVAEHRAALQSKIGALSTGPRRKSGKSAKKGVSGGRGGREGAREGRSREGAPASKARSKAADRSASKPVSEAPRPRTSRGGASSTRGAGGSGGRGQDAEKERPSSGSKGKAPSASRKRPLEPIAQPGAQHGAQPAREAAPPGSSSAKRRATNLRANGGGSGSDGPRKSPRHAGSEGASGHAGPGSADADAAAHAPSAACRSATRASAAAPYSSRPVVAAETPARPAAPTGRSGAPVVLVGESPMHQAMMAERCGSSRLTLRL